MSTSNEATLRRALSVALNEMDATAELLHRMSAVLRGHIDALDHSGETIEQMAMRLGRELCAAREPKTEREVA